MVEFRPKKSSKSTRKISTVDCESMEHNKQVQKSGFYGRTQSTDCS